MEGQALRVLLVNYEFPPIGGGAGRGTYHLARQLAKAGHQIDVLTSRLKGQPSQAVEEGYTGRARRSKVQAVAPRVYHKATRSIFFFSLLPRER